LPLLPDWFQISVLKPFHAKSTVEQLAAHLREEILLGGLGGGMPGVGKLVRHLGVGTQTVVAALEVLKQEGLLEGHGAFLLW
jgi:DNA-binding GntR family transcriptional regulator